MDIHTIVSDSCNIGDVKSKNVAWNLDSCDMVVENKIGVVRPASDAYAAEAVDALKLAMLLQCPLIHSMDLLVMLGIEYNFREWRASLAQNITWALNSANLSGQSSSVCIKDFENLWEHCAFVYDGGLLPSGRAGSTVVDLTTPNQYKILRPGSAKEETVAILEKHSLVEAVTTEL